MFANCCLPTPPPVRHAITSPNPVIPGMEKKREWKAHLEGVSESVGPEGHLERELTERLALYLWQLRRVTRHIVACTTAYIGNVERDYVHGVMYARGITAVIEAAEGERDDLPVPTHEELALSREQRLIPASSDLDKIMRYEGHLHRLFVQTLRELEALQARRLGQPVNLHRLDVSSPPSQFGRTNLSGF